MNKFFTKNIKIAIIAIIICLLLISGEVFAWFLISINPKLGNVNVDIISSDDNNGSINVTINGNTSSKDNPDLFLPGNTLDIIINIKNTTLTNNKYKLKINRIGVLYPYSKEEFNYSEKTINTDSYYILENDIKNYYDINNLTSTELTDLFNGFIEPMYNAIKYKFYYEDKNTTYIDFVEEKNKPTNSDLQSTSFCYLEMNNDIVISDTPKENMYVDSNGYIYMPAKTEIDLHFNLFFDPTYFPHYIKEVDSEQKMEYILENSNSFTEQYMHIIFGFDSIIDIKG